VTDALRPPNPTDVPAAEELTGEFVEKMRTAYHMSKQEFMQLSGLPGKSPARLYNIERNNSWKSDDREKVHAALIGLAASPPKGKYGRNRGETGVDRAARLDAKLREKGTHANGGGADPKVDAGPVLLDVSIDLDDLIMSEDGALDPTFSPEDLDDVRSITNSEVSVWQRCRRKWWLGIYRGLTLRQQDYMGYRAIGDRVHRALAAWYVPDGQERTDPREALERAIVEDWTALTQQARSRPSYGDVEQSLADLSARFNDAVALERAMVEGYMEWIAENGDDANLRVIAPETQISADIEGEVAGEKVRFRARAILDVRLRRISDDVRLFEDHKTVGNTAQRRKVLHMDSQMLHYMLLEFLNSTEGDERCDGALYNMLRRVKRTAQAKPPFYERVEVHHNAYEIEAYRRRLLGAARDIMRAERELNDGADPMSVVYPNPTSTCSWDCDFVAVCPMHDDGSRVDDAIAALYVRQDPMARYDAKTRNADAI
jgi:hypothetical protein